MQPNSLKRWLRPLAGALVFFVCLTNLRAADATNAPLAKKIPWDINITAGLTLTKGNSDTAVGNLLARGVRKWKKDEFDLGGDMTYGENNGVKNNEFYHGYAQFNHSLTERFYGSLRVEATHDGIADIKYRVVASPSAGYYLIKTTNNFLRVEAGPGYVRQLLGNTEKQYLTLRLGERGEFMISKTAKLWEAAEILPQVDDLENTIVNAEIGIKVDISAHFALSSCLQDCFNNEPAKGHKKNDIKLITGITYKF